MRICIRPIVRRFTLSAVLLLLASVGIAQQAQAEEKHDGRWLQKVCREADKDTGTRDYQDAGWCMGYIDGFLDGWSDLALVTGHGHMGPCVPSGVSYGQLVKVVRKYLDDHPERLHMSSRHLVIFSINTAFPCPTESAK